MPRLLFNLKFLLPVVAVLLLVALPKHALAAVNNADIYETVIDKYEAVASSWATTITNYASWLFWTLVVISMVWTFGMMALRKADLSEFFAEFVKFTIFTGFYWWLLTNGPNFAGDIIQSLRQIGGEATGLGPDLTPSRVSDIGFDIFFSTIDKATMRSPLVSFVGILLGAGILLLLALVAVNMLILVVSSWILLYGGVFFLGFGGSRWTSDMAINYYKTVLVLAASLFSMVLIIGVATSVMDQYYRDMGEDIELKALAVVLIVAFIMAMLVQSVPPLISGIITGASVGQGGAMGFGAGALVGAGAMAAAAVATGGAALAAGATSAAGGAQALMAAFSKAQAAEGVAGAASDLMAAASGSPGGGGGSGGGGSVFGDDPGGGSPGGSGGGGGRGGESPAGGEGGGGGSEGGQATGDESSGGKAAGSDAKGSSGGGEKSGGMMAKAGRIAAGTVGNLASGAMDVAKAKASDMKDNAMERIAGTTGGKIAAAINAGGGASAAASGNTGGDGHASGGEFGGNSLGSGDKASDGRGWINQTGGFSALSSADQAVATASHAAWQEQSGGNSFGVEDYVSYVQERQQERNEEISNFVNKKA